MSLRAVQSAVSPRGRRVASRYLLIATAMDLVWEVVQLPLYTLWRTATPGGLAYAVIHCTAGDLIILAAALWLALVLTGDAAWPRRGYARVALVAAFFGVSYTVFSEWLNVEVWRNWTYGPLMPLLPLGIGLTPFLQWLVIPPVAFVVTHAVLVRSNRSDIVIAGSRRNRKLPPA